MAARLDEAKTHYTTAMITSEELSKAKQVFGDDFPDEASARSGFFAKLKDEVVSFIFKAFCYAARYSKQHWWRELRAIVKTVNMEPFNGSM